MADGSHEVVRTADPAAYTLARIGATARAAADTQTVREWASRIATRAPPRDYRAMLEHIYRDILERWRYVPESEEWIHGTPSSLIGTVLGTKYNAPNADPTALDLARTPSREKGWGDCDDVATIVAAAVRAVGMRPRFRVARTPGGAHVSVLAETPAGEQISVDPVGHPDHAFGWEAPADDVMLFEMDGRPSNTFSGVESTMQSGAMYYSSPLGAPEAVASQGHWTATHAADGRGPRALAMPMREFGLFKRGIVVDGCPAIDDNGNQYTYDAPRDLWLDDRLMQTNLGGIDESMGGLGRRRRRRARRRRRRTVRSRVRRRRRARRRRIVRRVASVARPLVARVMRSKIAQSAVSAALVATGIPPALTRGVMAAASNILKQGGIPALIRLLRRDPRAAARLVAAAAKAGAVRARSPFSGDMDRGPVCYHVRQDGSAPFYAQPVVAMSGVPGMLSFGQLDVLDVPEPGSWYRIQRGDSLLKVAGRALGKPRGTHSKWINAAAANQTFHRPTKSGFESNMYGGGIISFLPRYSSDPLAASRGEPGNQYAVIWIPVAPGDEPPEAVPEPEFVAEPEPIPEVELEPEVAAETPPLPPSPEPVEPDDVDDEPAQPTEDEMRMDCLDAGGSWVPGRGCVHCADGAQWDWGAMACRPIEVETAPPPAIVPGPPILEPPELMPPEAAQVMPVVPDDVVAPALLPPVDAGAAPSPMKLSLPMLLAGLALLFG